MIVSTASSSSSFFLYRSVEEKKNRIGQNFLEKENILSVEEKKNGEYWEKESDDRQTNRQTVLLLVDWTPSVLTIKIP